MKLIDRYIARHVTISVLLVLAVMLALFTFIAFVDELGAVGKGDYSMGNAAEYLFLTMPRRAFNLFPLAALVGSVMALGLLAANTELTVIRASGVSVQRLLLSVMKAGAVLVVIALMIGELLAPTSEQLAQEQRSVAMTQQIAMKTAFGFWVRDGKSFINIRKALPDNRMADIYIYEFDEDRQLRMSTYAKAASYDDGKWLLEDVVQSELADGQVRSRRAAKADWRSLLEPELVRVVTVKPESLSAIGLYRYLDYLRDNGLETTQYELALWTKFAYPLATGVMIFLAVPLVLGRYQWSGTGQRVLVGVIVGIGFHIIHQAAVHLGVVYETPPALTALAPTVLFFFVALWLMRRVQ